MAERGYSTEFAERIIKQIQGFGEYGFPESHAASFALLVYVSAWLKCYEPAVFFCALLNSQPMGFYAPAQLVRCAREHGVEVRPPNVQHSHWDSTLEPDAQQRPCIRLGLRIAKGFSAGACARLTAARAERAFTSVQDLAERAALDPKELGCLAAADALKPLAGNRHQSRWAVAGVERPTPLLPQIRIAEATPLLKPPSEGEGITADYRQTGLTLGRHPLAVVRNRLSDMGIVDAVSVAHQAAGMQVHTAGLVITRQRPSSAAGVTFVTLEDETGYVNLIVWENVGQRCRRSLLGASLLGVVGKVQKEGIVLHVVAEQLFDYSRLLGRLVTRSRDFH
jgi:error-prone DNA polymerase